MDQGGVGLSKLEIGEQLPWLMDRALRILPQVAPIGGPIVGPVDRHGSNLRMETQLGLPPVMGLNPRTETHLGFSPATGFHPRTETQPRVLSAVGSNPRTETQSRVSPVVGSDAGMEPQAGVSPVVGSNPRMETQPGLLPVVGLNAGMETRPGVLSTMGLNPRMEIQSMVLSVVGSNPRTETQSGVSSVVGLNPRMGTQFGMSSTACLNPRMETQVLSTVGLNPRTETQPGVSSTVGSNPRAEAQPGGLSVVGSNPRMETQPGMSSMLGSNPRTETQPVTSSTVSSNARLETQLGVLSMAGSNQPTLQASTTRRLPSFGRNSDRNIYGTRQRTSPLNSGLWISIEAIITIGQIVSAIAVISVSRNEKPETPLSTYIIGYALGCIATLPLLYWRYSHHYARRFNQDSSLAPPPASPSSPPRTPRLSYSTPVGTLSRDEEAGSGLSSIRTNRHSRNRSLRLGILMERFKIALDCFFAVWFVVGNVWIFGGHSSASEAPNLYRLCIVFLTFSCIGYAMPFILCATVCCCLPCIITLLGFREDHGQTKGAAPEAIAVLPTYKFKAIYSTEAKRVMDGNDSDSEGSGEGGYIAIGTNKERAVSADDAVCCICLGKYNDGAELRELPCAHFFHTKCVDEWLKINASCPLCKHEIVSRDQED